MKLTSATTLFNEFFKMTKKHNWHVWENPTMKGLFRVTKPIDGHVTNVYLSKEAIYIYTHEPIQVYSRNLIDISNIAECVSLIESMIIDYRVILLNQRERGYTIEYAISYEGEAFDVFATIKEALEAYYNYILCDQYSICEILVKDESAIKILKEYDLSEIEELTQILL